MLGTSLKPASSLVHDITIVIKTIDSIFAIDMDAPFSMNDLWSVNKQNFNEIALEIFRFQAKNNAVYAEYLNLIDKKTHSIHKSDEIPFLPIALFKSHEVKTGIFEAQKIFESSSTTGLGTSKHHIKQRDHYHSTAKRIFEHRFGKLSELEVLGLLPNYLERSNSSLVDMVEFFMTECKSRSKEFYLYNHQELLQKLNTEGPMVLFGVSFALLDFCEKHKIEKEELLVIETGGMKGRKKEMTKAEVYSKLKSSFINAQIVSEYGMTELTSQAYSNEFGIYTPPSWMQVNCRLDNDPLSVQAKTQRGALNIIDLANIDSCCFIATDDIGKVYENGTFEVLGRLDFSDLRGCSLMV